MRSHTNGAMFCHHPDEQMHSYLSLFPKAGRAFDCQASAAAWLRKMNSSGSRHYVASRPLSNPQGEAFPYYIIPFDKDGRCEGPQTREHLIKSASGYSDIFLFSHGWNNDWKTASGRYESFIKGFQGLRKELGLAVPADYKPLLVGIFWPSQTMAWFKSETGPGFAGDAEQDEAATVDYETLRDVAAALPAENRTRFYELAQAQALEMPESKELATMLAAASRADDEGISTEGPGALDLLAAATSFETPEPDVDAIGAVGAHNVGPKAAFGFGDVLEKLDPRNIVKPFTVWQMKDRAGKVGAHGVAPLLDDLLKGSGARVHLLGHSFGCKVVMTAASKPAALSRDVESVLLLQPAVSQYAFCPNVPKRNVQGGFFRRPIVATFSANDDALTKMFHLAVRRSDDLGELEYAAGGSPSLYGALGGFGPQNSGEKTEAIRDPGEAYDLSGGGGIIGVNGTRTIGDHGDISNRSTWWLAYQLATAHQRYP